MSGASSTSPFCAPSWSRRSCKAANPSNSLRRVLPNSICRSTGPISAASWRAEERPSTECAQAKAWALLVERFEFPRGDCINACQRKVAKASRLVASTSRSLVSSRLTPPRTPGLYACATEGTGETDSVQEERRFEPSVPSRGGVTSSHGSEGPEVDYDGLLGALLLGGDRGFESPSLQRGVRCEPDFRGRVPSMAVGGISPTPTQCRLGSRNCTSANSARPAH